MSRRILFILIPLSVAMLWLNVSPPTLFPWWDCRVGTLSRNMDARIRLLSSCLETGSLSDKKKENAHYKRGIAYAVKGWQGLAIKDFTEAIQLNPKSNGAYYNRAHSNQELRRYGSAIKDYSEAIRLDSKDASALHNRGLLYVYLRKKDLALNDLSSSININPKNANALHARGQLYSRKEKYDLALDDLNKAIGLIPGKPTFFLIRANVHFRIKNWDKTILDANEAIRLSQVSGDNSSADDLRRLYNGFRLNQDIRSGKVSADRKAWVYKASRTLVISATIKKIKNAEPIEIMAVQKYLKDKGYFSSETDGVDSKQLLKALFECFASIHCETPRIAPKSAKN